MTERYEVAVVGGGPAGLASALAARASGLGPVVVLDQRQPPIDKACGEGLMPDAVDTLTELGVSLPPALGHPFRGIRYLDEASVAEGRFPSRPGLGLRRTELASAMIRAAEDAGVEVRWGERVAGLHPEGLATARGALRARWVVAADGLASRLRVAAGLEGRAAGRTRFGVRRHYRLAPWTDRVEVYWAERAEAYVTPVAADEIGVALLFEGPPAGFEALIDRFPRLAARLAGQERVSRDRGMGPLERRTRGVTAGRLALVGDASGYVDAITGEGLALAFHQAMALAEAQRRGDLGYYARRHRAAGRLPNGLTRLLLAIERRPRLRRRLLATLAAEPHLFDRLLAIHCRERPLSRLGLGAAGRLLSGLAGF